MADAIFTHEHFTQIAALASRKHGFSTTNLIGEGTFKQVFALKERGDLILKLFKHRPTPRDQREIQVCSSGKLRAVPRIYHADSIVMFGRDWLYVIEQRLVGKSLGQHLKEHGLLSIDDTARLAKGLLLSCQDIWSHRLVHRDIKPDNIFIGDSISNVHLLDLGLARHLDEVSLTQSWAMQGPGTPYFAPPEQLNNEKQLIDWRSDQFVISVTVSIAATNKHPYQLEGESYGEMGTVHRVAQRSGVFNNHFLSLSENCFSLLPRMAAFWPVQRLRLEEIQSL